MRHRLDGDVSTAPPSANHEGSAADAHARGPASAGHDGEDAPTDPTAARPADLAVVESEDIVTALARRPPELDLRVSKSVEIRSRDDESLLDETEVKTLADIGPGVERAMQSAAIPDLADSDPADADDAVTMLAPLTRGRPSAQPATPRSVPTEDLGAPDGSSHDPYDSEESVTELGVIPSSPSVEDDDSVTSLDTLRARRAAVARNVDIGARLGMNERRIPVSQAGGPAQAHTEVMVNAPLRPSDLGTTVPEAHSFSVVGAVGAPARVPSPLSVSRDAKSESGLRMADPAPIAPDRGSIRAIELESSHDGLATFGRPSPSSDGPIDALPVPAGHAGAERAEESAERKPRYAILVALVALVSVAVPIGVYVFLSAGAPVTPRATAVSSPDRVTREDVVRGKSNSAAAPPSADVAASASAGTASRATISSSKKLLPRPR